MKTQFAMLICLAALTVCPLTRAHAQSQGEMNETSERDFERADARLNVVYRQVRATLDATGRAKLAKAERAWIAYRDAEADFEADENRGGTMEPMVYSGVEKGLTNKRIKALRDYLNEMKNR